MSENSVARDALLKFIETASTKKQTELLAKQIRLAQLRLDYSSISNIMNTYLPNLTDVDRIYPTILPTQKNRRWSYLNPSLSNFPKKCINPKHSKLHHSKTSQCWGVRDCIIPDANTFWIEHDLDAVEHRIYALILQWKDRIEALKQGYEIHTPVTCDLFNLPRPTDKFNPHTAIADEEWRQKVKWQGKDDTRRTMSKNFTYGGQYFYVSLVHPDARTRNPYRIYKSLKYNPSFVFSIPNIQSYLLEEDYLDKDEYGKEIIRTRLVPPDYINLAVNFVESNVEIQKRKAAFMDKIRKDKECRTLYGARRKFFFSNEETAKEGFNGMIQGTVAGYINESAILLQKEFPTSYIIHNQHDSLKWCFTYESVTEKGREEEESQILERVKQLTQRDIEYKNTSMPITATFNIKRSYESHDS